MLNQDFKEFIESLNDSQVRYLVIGGYRDGAGLAQEEEGKVICL